MLALLAVAVLWMGVYPKPFTDVMHVSVAELLKHVGAVQDRDTETAMNDDELARRSSPRSCC